MKKITIIGAGGFGREVAWLIERINAKKKEWEIIGFIDDTPQLQNKTVNGYPVIGTTDDIAKFKEAYAVCAIGASRARETVIKRVIRMFTGIKFATLIDPSVEISPLSSIGEGSIICARTVISVNTNIGKHVISNWDCTIGHDAILDDFTTLYPSVNVSGNTRLGYACEVGTGTQIIQKKEIGDYTIVGAGAVVISDLPEKCTAVGVPAKPIKMFEN